MYFLIAPLDCLKILETNIEFYSKGNGQKESL